MNETTPNQPSLPPDPLEYWHSTDPKPMHPLAWGLFFCLGIAVGVGGSLVSGCFITVPFGIFKDDELSMSSFTAGLLVPVYFVLSAACGIWTFVKLRRRYLAGTNTTDGTDHPCRFGLPAGLSLGFLLIGMYCLFAAVVS